MGAFHDFAVVAARLRQPEPKPKSRRGRFRGQPAPQFLRVEKDQARWDDEGGNTQTRVAKRALKS